MKNLKGSHGHNWKGGRHICPDGYVLIYKPEHPYGKNGIYVREHRLVMEEYLRKTDPDHPALIEISGKLYLRPEWIVHHKGIKYPMDSIENKQDNRIDNLEAFSSTGKHKAKRHLKEKYPILSNKDWLYQKYLVDELSCAKIGLLIGCDPETVRKRIRAMGISIRSYSEAGKIAKRIGA